MVIRKKLIKIWFCWLGFGILFLSATVVFAQAEALWQDQVAGKYLQVLQKNRETLREFFIAQKYDLIEDAATQGALLEQEYRILLNRSYDVMDQTLLKQIEKSIVEYQSVLGALKEAWQLRNKIQQAQINAKNRVELELKEWRKELKTQWEKFVKSSNDEKTLDRSLVELRFNRMTLINILTDSLQAIQGKLQQMVIEQKLDEKEIRSSLDQFLSTLKALKNQLEKEDDLKRIDKMMYALNEFDKSTVQYMASLTKYYEQNRRVWNNFIYLERLSAGTFSAKLVFPSRAQRVSWGMLMTLVIPLALGLGVIIAGMFFALRPVKNIERLLKNQKNDLNLDGAENESKESLEITQERVLFTEQLMEMLPVAHTTKLSKKCVRLMKDLREVVFQVNLILLHKVIDNARLGIYGNSAEVSVKQLLDLARHITRLQRDIENQIEGNNSAAAEKAVHSEYIKGLVEDVVELAQRIENELKQLNENVCQLAGEKLDDMPSSVGLIQAIEALEIMKKV